jgi:sarcosine oxidase subunit alpha
VRTTQVAVVGGGPAGLSAAIAAARSGATTTLIDEQPEPGGQLRYRLAPFPLGVGPRQVAVRPWAMRNDLIAQARQAGVDLRPGALAWGLFADNALAVVEPGIGATYQLRADRIVLATGSTDLPFPFGGGSLPGVFAARAVQILLHLHRVLPGRRFAVVGDGPEAKELAADLRLAGGELVVRAQPADGTAIVAEGVGGVEAIWLGERRYPVDVVVVAVGRQPDPQLALMAGCAAGFSAALGGVVPSRDDRLTTTNPGILVAGDAAGLGDVPAMLAEGTLAGVCAAAALGLAGEAAVTGATRELERIAPGRLTATRAVRPVFQQGRAPADDEQAIR